VEHILVFSACLARLTLHMWEHLFVSVNPIEVPVQPSFTTAGLFAGIGGLELGFKQAGAESKLLCEIWPAAQAVLHANFPGVPVHNDIATLDSLPAVDVVAAGFPCTDLSQAGRMVGIHGKASGLVVHLFDLLRSAHPRWVVIENVRNMLVLDSGKAMSYLVRNLEELGFRWAYRLVDSRFTGVPQRRQRVLMVASRDEDPRTVLFADDAGEPDETWFRGDAFGFYWTEGLSGLGWAKDAVPTLKGGSSIGIPSPPAIWIPGESTGRAIVTPGIIDAERLQGFPEGWTAPAIEYGRRGGDRWKLTGNAVTVRVASWLGNRLVHQGDASAAVGTELPFTARWPTAAWGELGKRWQMSVSMWPAQYPYQHLLDTVDRKGLTPLSHKAAAGFAGRMERSTLRFDEGFRLAIKQHVEAMTQAA
jgi:DNA (cytosine-5)-methyltransferase 1